MEKNFYIELAKMKQILRRGWLLRQVPNRVESDAEHTFSMLMLALEIMAKNKTGLNELKVVKMIAYHELCEIDAGDTTPIDNVTKEEKFKKEQIGTKRIAEEYNMPEILALWQEFEENKTPEAKFVKALDKYDAIMQAGQYAKEYNRPDIYEEFKSNSIDMFNFIEHIRKNKQK